MVLGVPVVHVVVVSDTHLPTRAKDLPAPVWAAVEAADVVVHAGDWCDEATVLALRARSRRLVGVAGNNDGDALWARLGEVARVTVEGVRIAVVHETGAATGRERRCDERFGPGSDEPCDVLVFGHSHIPWDTTTPGGVRLLNPGSPTDRRRQPVGTVMLATIDGETIDVELVPTPR